MKCIFFVFVLLSSLKIEANNYIDYHKGISKAEALMFDSSFAESVKQFKTTFESFDFNYPRDCMIAAQVASTIKNDTDAFWFLKEGVRFGATIERIRIIPRLVRLQKSEMWNDFIESYDSLHQVYLSSLNWSYRELCYTYTIRDKINRDKDQAHFSNRLVVLKPKVRRKWLDDSKEAIDTIIKLIPKYGYPSYRTIGTMPVIDPFIEGSRLYLSSAFISVILYHYAPYEDISQYSDVFLEEVKKGNLHARDYAFMMEFDNRRVNGTKDIDSKYYIWWVATPKIDEIHPKEEEINKRREELGIGSCRQERFRKNWQFKYNWEFFYFEI